LAIPPSGSRQADPRLFNSRLPVQLKITGVCH
jgi:hypothetical protein